MPQPQVSRPCSTAHPIRPHTCFGIIKSASDTAPAASSPTYLTRNSLPLLESTHLSAPNPPNPSHLAPDYLQDHKAQHNSQPREAPLLQPDGPPLPTTRDADPNLASDILLERSKEQWTPSVCFSHTPVNPRAPPTLRDERNSLAPDDLPRHKTTPCFGPVEVVISCRPVLLTFEEKTFDRIERRMPPNPECLWCLVTHDSVVGTPWLAE